MLVWITQDVSQPLIYWYTSMTNLKNAKTIKINVTFMYKPKI